ncbi:hypothetical protein TWF481_009754 [Arthrobotrys musiformis]|uniref:Uncharacterized protein n=1 Tax=Arthrobotrys musiformis TaxID=47236 RepID=A0AAV9W4S1_9PEZI
MATAHPILQLFMPQDGKWMGYIPSFVALLGIGAVSMNYLRDYLEENTPGTKRHRLRLPPTGGNIYFHIPAPTHFEIPPPSREPEQPPSPPPEYLQPSVESQRFVIATDVLDIQLEPILGHTAWHNNPDFAEVRVPLEAEKVGVRGRPAGCDGRVEMWWDGRKGVGLVRL